MSPRLKDPVDALRERAEAAEREVQRLRDQLDEAVKLLRDYPFPSSGFTDYENGIARFLAQFGACVDD